MRTLQEIMDSLEKQILSEFNGKLPNISKEKFYSELRCSAEKIQASLLADQKACEKEERALYGDKDYEAFIEMDRIARKRRGPDDKKPDLSKIKRHDLLTLAAHIADKRLGEPGASWDVIIPLYWQLIDQEKHATKTPQ